MSGDFRFNPRIAFEVKKKLHPSLVFESVKLSVRCPFVTFYEYGVIQNATIRSPIGAPEVVRHDVKRKRILFERNFMVMLTNMTKQIQNKYCSLIQVTKSNFPTTATSKKVCPQKIATTTDNRK